MAMRIMMVVLASLNFCFILPAFTQQTIKGRVVTAVEGTAVPGSSIFISGSSKGTSSATDGKFLLTDVPVGKYELIISSIGYETVVYSFDEKKLPLQLKVELTVKVKELESVLVEPSLEEGWDKWGAAFMSNFIGTTPNAAKCKVKNGNAIRFRYYKKSNRLIAYCDEPVVIENKALGYLISYQLENFEINFSNKSMFFIGYPLYIPMENKNNSKDAKWTKRRQGAYNGSVMHFMRSLYSNRLVEEGFEVRRMIKIPNAEKQRVKEIIRDRRIFTHGQVLDSIRTPNAYDSSGYYRSVLAQDDFKDIYGNNILNADSLIVERTDKYQILHFDNYLFITYKNEIEEADYAKGQYPSRAPTFQRSYVTLLNEKLITFDETGNYYNPQDFFTAAYWGWSEKIADSLPVDYK